MQVHCALYRRLQYLKPQPFLHPNTNTDFTQLPLLLAKIIRFLNNFRRWPLNMFLLWIHPEVKSRLWYNNNIMMMKIHCNIDVGKNHQYLSIVFEGITNYVREYIIICWLRLGYHGCIFDGDRYLPIYIPIGCLGSNLYVRPLCPFYRHRQRRRIHRIGTHHTYYYIL